jgi:hypothetical protein
LLIVGFIVRGVLWFAGQIGDKAAEGSKWYIVPDLLGVPLAMWSQRTCRLVPTDQSTCGWPFISTIATIVFVLVMINQLQNGVSEAVSDQNIIIGFWLLALTVNFRSLVPIWVRLASLVWAVGWIVDVFLHVLAAKTCGSGTTKTFLSLACWLR